MTFLSAKQKQRRVDIRLEREQALRDLGWRQHGDIWWHPDKICKYSAELAIDLEMMANRIKAYNGKYAISSRLPERKKVRKRLVELT